MSTKIVLPELIKNALRAYIWAYLIHEHFTDQSISSTERSNVSTLRMQLHDYIEKKAKEAGILHEIYDVIEQAELFMIEKHVRTMNSYALEQFLIELKNTPYRSAIHAF